MTSKDRPEKELNIKQASELAKEKLGEALDKTPNSTAAIHKEGDEWAATVEIVDEEYLPNTGTESMNDILGVYEVKLNSRGELLSWTKKSSRKRGSTYQ